LTIYDRTEKLVSAFLPNKSPKSFRFDGFKIGIDADPVLAETFNGQVMMLTCFNLISRFINNISLGKIPDVPVLGGPHKGRGNLKKEIGEIVMQVNPDTALSLLKRDESTDVLIALGRSDCDSAFKIAINSDGWIARLEEGPEASVDCYDCKSNPIGAQVASCFASAEVFKHILKLLGSRNYAVQNPVQSICFSAFDYSFDSAPSQNPELPEELDLNEVILVGAGAVGSSFVNTLAFLEDVVGRLIILDFDVIDITNLNRYQIAGWKDVGKSKVNVAASFLSGSRLEVAPIGKSYESFVREDRPDKAFDTVVSTVDDNAARQHIQSDLPRQILHGATNEQTCVVSRHDFLHDACLGCLFYSKSITYAERIHIETGIPLEEVEKALTTNDPFSNIHLAIMVKERNVDPKIFSQFVGQPFSEVYAKEICGVLGLTLGAKAEAATVSFVSSLPGIFLVGEIIKDKALEMNQFRLDNYLQMSLFSLKANTPIIRKKDPRCSCLCYEPIMIDRYKQKWMNVLG